MSVPALPNIQVTKYDNRSHPTALLHFLVRPFGPLITGPGKPLPAGSPRLTPHASSKKRCNVSERCVKDIWVYDITAKSADIVPTSDISPSGKHRRIFYIAGGSFCMPPSSDHWKFLTALAERIPRCTISLLSPPLAPHSPAPATFPHLIQVFKSLLFQADEANETVVLMGDSSGANLVLSVTLALLHACDDSAKGESPESLMLISPVVDLRFSNPDIKQVEHLDPVLRLNIEKRTAAQWAGDWPLGDWRLSPLLADLKVLRESGVKVHGITGGYDLLTPDSLLFRDNLEREGVVGTWLQWEKQMHCFPLAFTYRLPESVRGIDWVIEALQPQA